MTPDLLWEMADKMRGHMDAGEYKHIVLGLIFLKYIESDLVDCMIALPGQLFYTTPIPVCLWFVTRSKKADKRKGHRDRKGEMLFIDCRKMGTLVDRVHRELTDDDLDLISGTYHAWRSEGQMLPSPSGRGAGGEGRQYVDKPGWWKSAMLDKIKSHGYVLTPGRYVGAEEVEDDGIPFEEKMAELFATLYQQFDKADQLEAVIRKNLEVLGYGK